MDPIKFPWKKQGGGKSFIGGRTSAAKSKDEFRPMTREQVAPHTRLGKNMTDRMKKGG